MEGFALMKGRYRGGAKEEREKRNNPEPRRASRVGSQEGRNKRRRSYSRGWPGQARKRRVTEEKRRALASLGGHHEVRTDSQNAGLLFQGGGRVF